MRRITEALPLIRSALSTTKRIRSSVQGTGQWRPSRTIPGGSEAPRFRLRDLESKRSGRDRSIRWVAIPGIPNGEITVEGCLGTFACPRTGPRRAGLAILDLFEEATALTTSHATDLTMIEAVFTGYAVATPYDEATEGPTVITVAPSPLGPGTFAGHPILEDAMLPQCLNLSAWREGDGDLGASLTAWSTFSRLGDLDAPSALRMVAIHEEWRAQAMNPQKPKRGKRT